MCCFFFFPQKIGYVLFEPIPDTKKPAGKSHGANETPFPGSRKRHQIDPLSGKGSSPPQGGVIWNRESERPFFGGSHFACLETHLPFL